MSLKNRIDNGMDIIIRKTDKIVPGSSLPKEKIESIKKTARNVFRYVFLILESLVISFFYLKIIPDKAGWPFAQTAVMTSIFILLLFNIFKAKNLNT
jgi:hypothetical protein